LKHEVMQLTEEEKLGATHPCLITDTKSTSEEELVDGEERIKYQLTIPLLHA
jgi:hypothetical protein